MHLRPLQAIAVLLGLVTASLNAAESPAAPPVNEIVDRAVARDDKSIERRTCLKCDQSVRTERFDSDGKVSSVKTDREVHLPPKGITYSTNVGGSEKADAAAEVGRKQSEQVKMVMNLGTLRGRFQMALGGEGTVQGRDCYIVKYWPKAGQSSDTREEKVVNNLKGRFWIAKDDYSILQSEGTLSSPVTVALIATVNRVDFQYHAQPLSDGECVPSDFSVNIAVKAPFYDFREKKTTAQSNWRPR